MYLFSPVYFFFFYILMTVSNVSYTSPQTEQTHKSRQEDSHKKKHEKSKGMHFWFFSKSDLQKKHRTKVLDTYTIFNFDQEIVSTLSNTKELQQTFKQQNRLLQVQIDHLEATLLDLIKQQKDGIDKSKEIIETYTLLFDLCNDMYQLKDLHTKQIHQLFEKTHQDYIKKTSTKIENAKVDSQELIEELIEQYNIVHE